MDMVSDSLAKHFIRYIEPDEFRLALVSFDSSDRFAAGFSVAVGDVNESVGADERFGNGSAYA
jgi:hypothetical protein